MDLNSKGYRKKSGKISDVFGKVSKERRRYQR
jgi:hypothetical protein